MEVSCARRKNPLNVLKYSVAVSLCRVKKFNLSFPTEHQRPLNEKNNYTLFNLFSSFFFPHLKSSFMFSFIKLNIDVILQTLAVAY